MNMNKITFLHAVLCFFVCFFFVACGDEKEINTESPYIDGLSLDTYPIIDGSTSTLPLNTVIACELMGIGYEWQENKIDFNSSKWDIKPEITGKQRQRFNDCIKSSQTHQSFANVIDKVVDIALTARTMSPDEKEYAEGKGVTLIETPIAMDAFIFIVNARNPVKGLTTKNIQDIYTGKVRSWEEFGVEIDGGFPMIHPFIRNANSGSQELMDLLVMKGLDYINLPIYEEALVSGMMGLLDEIGSDPFAIGYTVYYYNEFIIRPHKMYLKAIEIDGVQPDKNTIVDRSYPYTTEVYAVIRSDMDKSSMGHKVYEWLQTEAGKAAIAKSGYVN